MSDPTFTDSASGPIEQQAAAWVLRQDRGLTAAEQDDYLQWLAADPRHGAALARHQRNWDRLNLLAQWRPEHGPRPNRDLLAATAPARPAARRTPVRHWWWVAVPLAAAVAAGLFLNRPSVPPPAGPLVAANTPAAVTAIERRELADGSVIELNRGAEVAVLFTATTRQVRLERGEAHFTVARQPDRPFIVAAAGVEVRAVGTAFNVRVDAAAVEVLVTSGRVQVREPETAAGKPGSTVDLAVSQSAIVPIASAEPARPVSTLTEDEIAARLLWQPRLLDFTATTLLDIVGEFNRRNAPYRLVVADSELAHIPVSASLRSDNIEGFIRLLEAGFGVRVERSGHDITLHRR